MTKSLLSVFDLAPAEIWNLLKSARALKAGKRGAPLAGKTLGMIFEKPSTRTSVSFSVAMYQLGGFPLMLDVRNMQRKRGETIQDTAKTLSRYLDAIVIRAFNHGDVVELAAAADIPVINGLTDNEHPCQIFGDIMTILEHRKITAPAALKKVKVAFIGDGNNVANSLMGACALLGMDFSIATPRGYEPDNGVTERSRQVAESSGSRIELTTDPAAAARDADVIYTDVWTSMGEEAEQKKREKAFRAYQVNRKLLELARPGCLVMHCLPAHRGEEITAEVIDGPNSVVFDQAENRLHIQKAILIALMQQNGTKRRTTSR